VTVRAVVFDLGETLVDETRLYARWADRLGVAQLTFFAVLGGLIERGEPHSAVFSHFHSDFDLAVERQRWTEPTFTAADLYPDVLPTLAQLRARGYRLGVAGNQPAVVEAFSGTLPVDFVGSSESWGAEKPSPAFFARLAEAAGAAPGEVAYVGDRVDNDVLPAAEAGLAAVFLRRGPWGHLQASWPAAFRASARLESLAELPDVLPRL